MSAVLEEVRVIGAADAAGVWGSVGRQEPRQRAAVRSSKAMTFNAWLSAEEVALLILIGECAEVGISVPARFSAQAIESALASVERWTQEGRIFAIHDLYPRYQFDSRGRPHPPVERALALFGRGEPLRVGNWFAAPNPYLGGKRPQELLSTAPAFVTLALQKVIQAAN